MSLQLPTASNSIERELPSLWIYSRYHSTVSIYERQKRLATLNTNRFSLCAYELKDMTSVLDITSLYNIHTSIHWPTSITPKQKSKNYSLSKTRNKELYPSGIRLKRFSKHKEMRLPNKLFIQNVLFIHVRWKKLRKLLCVTGCSRF